MLLTAFLRYSAWAASPCADKETAWKALLQDKSAKDPEKLSRKVEAFRAKCGIPLGFWPGPKAEQSQKNEHPCGEWVRAFVSIMPTLSDPIIQPEEIFEFSPSGKIIQRWWAPVDAVVDGIAGDELLITEKLGEGDDYPVQLAIKPRGKFRVVPLTSNPQATPIACPSNPDLPHSGYSRCWSAPDQVSGAERRLAYEGPCS